MEKNKRIYVRVSMDDLAKIGKLSNELNTSKSEAIRAAVNLALINAQSGKQHDKRSK